MFKIMKNAWSIPDLRRKLLFTLLIIIVFRIGSVIPVPFLDSNVLAQVMAPATDVTDAGSNMIAYLNTLSGGAFSNATLFAMGITPYINSSIIIQLLCVAIPALERLSKEGEAGRRKIGTITRYTTVALGLIQGTAYFFYLKNTTSSDGAHITIYNEGFSMVFAGIVIVLRYRKRYLNPLVCRHRGTLPRNHQRPYLNLEARFGRRHNRQRSAKVLRFRNHLGSNVPRYYLAHHLYAG